MIFSMTAYSNLDFETEKGNFHFEIRSVNHRYLELSIKVPEGLRDFEGYLRDIARKQLNRGKVECVLKFEKKERKASELNLDLSLVESLIAANDQILKKMPKEISFTFSPLDILSWPGVIKGMEVDVSELKTKIEAGFLSALDILISARAREGEALKGFIVERILKMKKEIELIAQYAPRFIEAFREKIHRRLEEIKVEIDKERFLQEIIYITQKMDISEELDRLEMHLEEVLDILNKGGTVGRRLDFLMQELNREANTLGSKSQGSMVAKKAVELKVLIEEMREQIQNLE